MFKYAVFIIVTSLSTGHNNYILATRLGTVRIVMMSTRTELMYAKALKNPYGVCGISQHVSLILLLLCSRLDSAATCPIDLLPE